METPICDFLKQYAETDVLRLHMPGHKGRGRLGVEQYDITEVSGADSLYEAAGIDGASRLRLLYHITLPGIRPTIVLLGTLSLGNVLNFSSEQSAANMVLGFYDAQKVLYGLYGREYYIDRTMTEEEAYALLVKHLRPENTSLRQLNEEILPKFAKRVDCEGDYYKLFIVMMERLAKTCSLTPFRSRTDREFYEEVMTLRNDDIPDKPDKVLDLFFIEE